MEVLNDHNRVPIFHVVEVVDLGSEHFSDNGHRRSLDNRRWVEKLLLERQKSPLRLLAVENRSLSFVERHLQQFDLRAFLEPLRLEDHSTEDHDLSLVRLRSTRQLAKANGSVNERLERFWDNPR